MENKPAFGCHAINKFQMNFPNGNWISTVWGAMTYSDNYNLDIPLGGELKDFSSKGLFSNTVEIMFTCPDRLRKRILKKYNGGNEDPVGYLDQKSWLEIVNLLAK